MALQDSGLAVLITWCSGFTDKDITCLVLHTLQAVLFCKLVEIGHHLLLFSRRTGNLVDDGKVMEYGLGLQL